MIRKIFRSKWNLVIMLVTWLVLIWSHTFVKMANGFGTTSFEVLGKCVVTILLTFLWGCNLYAWDDETGFFPKEEEMDKSVPISGKEDSEESDLGKTYTEEMKIEESDSEKADIRKAEHENAGSVETEDAKASGMVEERVDLDDEESYAVESLFMKLKETESCCRESGHNSGLRNSLCVVLAIAVICLLSFALSDWTDGLDLFGDSTYMQIGWFCINKKYVYDLLAVIIFPLWTTFIIRKVKESKFTIDSVFSGIIQILALTLIGFLLYMRRTNIWLIEMAILNVITLILAVRGYAWRDIPQKGNAVGLLTMYALFWIALISIFYHSNQTITDFMGFTDTTQVNSYFTNVHKIVENASFVGQNSTLLNDPKVAFFIRSSYYLIPSVLFYGGWLPAALLMIVEVIFIFALAGVLVQAREHDGRDIMLDMILGGFFLRVIIGFLYSFGVPIPILLPFAGKTGIVTDSICMGMLLLGFVNKKWNDWCDCLENDLLEDLEADGYEEDDE